jgi:hypothetical protein
MSFSLDLKAFAEKAQANANAVVRETVLAVDRALVEKSPVGNPELWKHPAPPGYVGGRFRANWQYGENQPTPGELYTPIVGPFPSAAESVERETAKIAPDAGGKLHYLTNNLPYAQALEDGHSATQAPAGIVGITVIEFVEIVKAAAATL